MELKKVGNKNHRTLYDLPNLKSFGTKVVNPQGSVRNLFFLECSSLRNEVILMVFSMLADHNIDVQDCANRLITH
jgi:hypothetical protein